MKRSIMRIITLATFIMLAAELSAAINERAAIVDFKAYNCDESLARIATDFISTKIFEAKIFTIVEREQIDKVIREIELQKKKYTESESAVKMGNLLAAQKTIIGSVHKIDKYYIVLKIINVADGTVEGDYRVSANNESGLEEAADELLNMMLFDFKQEVFYSWSLSMGFFYRAGDFAKIADYGAGVTAGFNVHNLLYKNTVSTLSIGLYSFKSKYASIDSLVSMPVLCYAGYAYKISAFRITPGIGFGYMISMMNYDKDGVDAYGHYKYTKRYYFDPAVSVKCDIDYMLFSNIHLTASPVYTIFFEKNHSPQIAGINLGAKMLF